MKRKLLMMGMTSLLLSGCGYRIYRVAEVDLRMESMRDLGQVQGMVKMLDLWVAEKSDRRMTAAEREDLGGMDTIAEESVRRTDRKLRRR